MVRILLEHGADINKQNGLGKTALYLAAENGNLALVAFLVKEEGVEIDLGDKGGVTPIMIATIKGHTEIVKFLMPDERRAERDVPDANLTNLDIEGHTILHFAAMNNRHEVLSALAASNKKLLARVGKDKGFANSPKQDNKKLLVHEDKDKDKDKRFFANSPNHEENTALHLAAQAGHLETVRELLKEEYNVDVDNKNWDEQTPSHLAAAEGHSDVLGLLLQNDPNAIFDKDEDDNTPLHLAATRKQSSTVGTLLAAGKFLTNEQQF